MLRDCFDLCLAVCICKCVYVYVSGLHPATAGGSNDVRLLPASTHTHTHFLSAALCSPVSVPLDPIVLEIHSSYRVASLCCFADTSARTHAKTPTHAHTHACRNTSTVDWLDYTSRAAQPDRGTRTKKETRKEYKRLICPCCISMFHLPTLAYPHPHRLDPIASARPLYLATQTSPCEGILQSSSFS